MIYLEYYIVYSYSDVARLYHYTLMSYRLGRFLGARTIALVRPSLGHICLSCPLSFIPYYILPYYSFCVTLTHNSNLSLGPMLRVVDLSLGPVLRDVDLSLGPMLRVTYRMETSFL